jgi:hypothetical protein
VKKEGANMHLDNDQRRKLTLILMPLAALFLFGLTFVGAALFSVVFTTGRHIFDWHYLYIILLCVGYGIVLKLKLPIELKATLLSLPVVAVLVKIGIETSANIILTYLISAMFLAILLGYLYFRRNNWLYSYAVSFTAVIVLFNILTRSKI